MLRTINLLILFLLPVLSVAQIVNIEERRITGTNDTTNWYGFVRFGANLVKVKDQVLQINATGQVQYKKDRGMILLLLDGKFLRAGNQDFNNAGFSHLRYNYKITDPLVFEAFAQAQYNKLLLIELRALAGSGLRFRLFKDESGKNRIYAGTAYLFEHNRFTEITAEENWHRWSNYLSFTFRPWENVKLINTTYYQPQIGDFKNYRFSSETRLDVPLGKKLSFSIDFTYSIDQSLPDTAPVSTYAWLNSLTWRLN
jgi:hypothetical protein